MKTDRYGFTKLTASFVLFGCILSAQADALPADLAAAGVQPAKIHITGDTVYYYGNISSASTEAFKAAVGAVKRGDVTRMVISSVGGETRNGREIGQWVHDMAVIVEIDRVCFSSCANYIFPAGRARVIRTNAMVGWHGNERGMEIDTRKRGLSLAAKIRSMLPAEVLNGSPESIQGHVDEALASMRTSMQEEVDFFARLGLRDAFSTCAVGDAASAKYPGLKDRKGWGFSIPDMERLGLVNTVYLGDGTYEKDSTFFRKYLGLLSADACWLLLSENQPQQ
jgi:hypothetical protein